MRAAVPENVYFVHAINPGLGEGGGPLFIALSGDALSPAATEPGSNFTRAPFSRICEFPETTEAITASPQKPTTTTRQKE